MIMLLNNVIFLYYVCRSICLLLQIALPCLLFAKERSELILRGGTDVDMAPPIDYTLKVSNKFLCDTWERHEFVTSTDILRSLRVFYDS